MEAEPGVAGVDGQIVKGTLPEGDMQRIQPATEMECLLRGMSLDIFWELRLYLYEFADYQQ